MPFRCTMYTDRSFMPANYPQQLHSLTTGLLILQHILSKPSYSVPPFKLLSQLLRSPQRHIRVATLIPVAPISHPVQTHISATCVCLFTLPYHMQHTSFTIKPQLTLQLLCSSSNINLSMGPQLLCSFDHINCYINCYNLYRFYSRNRLIRLYLLCSLNCIKPASRVCKVK